MTPDSDIPMAWGQRAPELTHWTRLRLLNRDDGYLSYLAEAYRGGGGSITRTMPPKDERHPGVLTDAIVSAHYAGYGIGDLIGVHAIGPDNLSRWLVVDIDKHDDDSADAGANLAGAVALHARLRGLGFQPLLLDSNGAGGFHLLVVFGAPTPSETVYRFGRWLAASYTTLGLPVAPETFPKQVAVTATHPYGSAWRLPGRHHTRPHWTRVWDGGLWLDGQAAINRIVAYRGDDPALIPADARAFEPRPKAILASRPPHWAGSLTAPAIPGICRSTREFLAGAHWNAYGTWNARIFGAACDLAGCGVPHEKAEELLLAGAKPVTPDDEEIARRTIESAYSQERKSARAHAAANSTTDAPVARTVIHGITINTFAHPARRHLPPATTVTIRD